MEKPKYELKKIYIKEDIKNKIIYNVEEHIQNYKNINSIIFGKPEIIKYKFSDCLCKVGNKWKMSVAILNKFLEKNILDSYGRNIAHYISTFNGTHKFLSKIFNECSFYNIEDKDIDGYTCLDYAKAYKCEKNIELLEFIEKNKYVPEWYL